MAVITNVSQAHTMTIFIN